tara:strand:+ start:294 stop:956 length:663 start_codon:yes stop_codon:yes gene_type:complete
MSVTILIPTYNRFKFSELISLNINLQTYPLIKEIIIGDDGNQDERLNIKCKYSVLYFIVPKMSIGAKRNYLKSKATTEYLIHMDTDDFYNPDYISNCIFNLLKHGKQLTGSSDMLMINSKNLSCYNQSCIYMNLLNEATLCYTKEYSNKNNFSNNMSSEGIIFCKCEDIIETPIEDIMICITHDENTVSKNSWLIKEYEHNIDLTNYKNHLEILSNIFIS